MFAEILAVTTPTVVIYEDNQACIHMATNPIVSAHNRHFVMRMWWLRDQVANKTLAFPMSRPVSCLPTYSPRFLLSPSFTPSATYFSPAAASTMPNRVFACTPGGVSTDIFSTRLTTRNPVSLFYT